MDNPMQNEINEYQKIKEDMEKMNKEENPGSILLGNLTETILKILQNKELLEMFKKLETQGLNPETIKMLVNIIALVSTHAAYHSILFYDDLLKDELTKQFNSMAEFMNIMKADINGISGACVVYKTKIGELENKLKIDEISKN